MDRLCYFCLVFVMRSCASVLMPCGHLLFWPSFLMSNCEFVTLGQVRYLIVSIPAICPLS